MDHLGHAHFEGAAVDSFPIPPSLQTIYHLIHSWPDHWPLEDSHFPDDPSPLIQAIQEGRAHGVCDGSYMSSLATDLGVAAWKIEDPLTQQAMYGTTQTSGAEIDVDPYHSELQGVHAMLLGTLAFCTFHQITMGRVRLGCDNSNSVRHGKGDWCKVPLSIAHADLIRAIRIIKSKLPITMDFEHVYGHQDDLLSFEDLPRLAQLNVQMDSLAKRRLVQLHERSPTPRCPSSLAHEGWQCTINGIKITSNPGKAIHHADFGSKLQAFLVSKKRITRSAFDDIDWEAMATATDLFPPLYRLWVSKHVSGFFGIGTMMFNWKYWEHSQCPCCHYEREDKLHLLTCPHANCTTTWQNSLAVRPGGLDVGD